jgi:hypothetical protein
VKFDKPQLVEFVKAVDRNLKQPASLFIIGSAAATLAYDAAMRTADIDVEKVIEGHDQDVLEAAHHAREETGLGVAISPVTVASLPENYQDRVREIRSLRLYKLKLFVPDRYDLALSKAMRGHPHDLEAIEGMHRSRPLVQKKLVDRFEAELMNIVGAGDRRIICLNMAMVVAQLFGNVEARKLAERWDVPVPQIGRRYEKGPRG